MYGKKGGLVPLLSKHAIIPRQKRLLSHDKTASFRSLYNTEPKAAVPHDLTASFLSAYNTEPKAVGSGFRVSRSLCTCA